MKKLFFVLLFVVSLANAQSIERQVIGSSGAILTDGSTVSLGFTVGELVVATITDGSSTTLTQGFHQTKLKLEIHISPLAFLQGALLNPNTGEESVMRDDLRIANYIPTMSPYIDGATCDPSVFTTTGSNAIVDWVLVELRDKNDNTNVLHSQSALLQRDGDIVATDGISVLSFEAVSDNYYVSIKHRNHLGVMSATTLALSNTTTIINFADANNQITYGANAQTTFGMPANVVAMWAGDVNNDGVVQYTGANPDSPEILSAVLSDPANFLGLSTHSMSGYSNNDIDMNGSAQYVGSLPDTPFVLQNVLADPANFLNLSTHSIIVQLP